jgi:hypothetical protein
VIIVERKQFELVLERTDQEIQEAIERAMKELKKLEKKLKS